MRRLTPTATVLAALALCASPALADPPLYHVRTMGPALEAAYPGNMFLSSQFRAINQAGDAVGEVGLDNGLQHAFIYTVEHGVVELPLVGGAPAAQAMDLTDRDENGEIIIVGGGVHGVHDYAITAVVWRFSTITGEVLETRNVGNLPGFDEGKLFVVNNNGIALGVQGENVFGAVSMYNVHTGAFEPFAFPAAPADLNDAGQLVGGRYVGDLDGALTQMEIPPDCTSLTLTGINSLGWLAGRAGRPYSDGAGRRLANWVRHTDTGWHVPDPGSPWDSGFAMNSGGDITIGFGPGWIGGVYLADEDEVFALASLLDDEFDGLYSPDYAYGINDNRQIAAASGHAVLLTPLGRMIIPGDVNGDAEVNHDDHCAWSTSPIDLDGDGDIDDDDERWLIDRLAVFGFIYQDCNGNGVNDHCDITEGVSNDCNGNGVPDECEDDCDGNGIPDACEADCNGNGVPDPCDIAGGTSEDCNGNGIPDECDGADTVEAGVVYDPPQRLFSDDTFTETVLVTEPGTIADVDFVLRDSFRIGQTTVRISHAGITVTVIDRPGDPAFSDGFVNLSYDITLDDEGAGPNIETVGDFCCRFDGVVSPPAYRPHEPLSAFDGLPREGLWTFEFIGGFAQTFDPKLEAWSVRITDEEAEPGDCCPADFNDDGDVNTLDVLDFLNAWNAGEDTADFNDDGDVNTLDVLDFLNTWNTGC
ncbi:MAG: GC-type dockerin domain-anchored protein [Phycisphaerales bacterium JB041]